MKKVIGLVVAGSIMIALLTSLIFGSLKLDNISLSIFGKERANISREIYKESNSYVEGMISDLADAKREYDRTEDENEKQQVLEYVNSKFSNFDINKIEDDNLYRFLLKARK